VSIFFRHLSMRVVAVGGAAGPLGRWILQSLLRFPDTFVFAPGASSDLTRRLPMLPGRLHLDDQILAEGPLLQALDGIRRRIGEPRAVLVLPNDRFVTTAGRSVAAITPAMARGTKTVDLREYAGVVFSRTILRALPPTVVGTVGFVTTDGNSPAAKMARDLALVVRKQFERDDRLFRVREFKLCGGNGGSETAPVVGEALAGWLLAETPPPFVEAMPSDLPGIVARYPLPPGDAEWSRWAAGIRGEDSPPDSPPPPPPFPKREKPSYPNPLDDWLPGIDFTLCSPTQLKEILDRAGVSHLGVDKPADLLRLVEQMAQSRCK